MTDPRPEDEGPGRSGDAGRPLKVVDVTKFYSESGGGVKTYLSAKRDWAAARPDIEHVVVIPGARDGLEESGDGTRVYRIRGPRIPMSPAYRFLLSTRKLRRILREERPDVIEVGSPFLVPWIALRAAKGLSAAFVGFFHCDIIGAYTGRLMPNRPRWLHRASVSLTRRYVRATYNRFAVTIAATEAAERLLRDAGVEHTAQIPLAVDTRLFHPDRRDPGWRAELDAPAGAPLLLYAGRLCREKEVDVLIRAAPGLHDASGAITVFVGDGHLRPEIEDLMAARPEVARWVPYQTDRESLARIYASADVYLAPFSYETFGLSALEAMASGLPVVGSRSLGLSDLLQAERGGFTFAPGDARDLIDVVTSALAADRAELGRRARSAAESYSWDRTFETELALYQQLADTTAAQAASGRDVGAVDRVNQPTRA